MSKGYKQKQNNAGKRYQPLVRVSFHTSKACYQVKGKFPEEDHPLDPTYQIIAVHTEKNMSDPAGAFSVELAGAQWLSRLRPNDLVVIQMGYRTAKGEELDTVMVGLVDRIHRLRDASIPQVTTTVTGRDFGKILIKSQLKFYPELGQMKSHAKTEQKFFMTDESWVTMMGFFTNENISKGTPAIVLDNIMRYILPKVNTVKWKVWDETKKNPLPKEIELTHVLRYNFAKVDISLPMILSADQFEGAIWNLMERASIKPFTELFVDTRKGIECWNPGNAPRVVNESIEHASDKSKRMYPKGKGYYPSPRFRFGEDHSAVAVFLRNTPFDEHLWKKLYTHQVQAEDVLSEELSISDDEHYNLFWAGTTLTPFGASFNLKKIIPPLWNQPDVTRYGLSPLEVNVEGFALHAGDSSNLLGEFSQAYSAKLKSWYEKNHEYMNGFMTVRGKGSYKIGQRLVCNGIQREFYIEGVSHRFDVYERWVTTLSVTRGRVFGQISHPLQKRKKENTAFTKQKIQKNKTEIKSGFYTVKQGDTLWKIAANPKIYGQGRAWTKLWNENKALLMDRDRRNETEHGRYIYPGQVLRVKRE